MRIFLFALFLMNLHAATAQTSGAQATRACIQIFTHFSQLEPLLNHMASYETKIVEALASPDYVSSHNVLSLRLSELQTLITEALATPASSKQRIIELSAQLESITRGVERHLIQDAVTTAVIPSSQGLALETVLSKSAEKDLDHLQPYLLEKYNEFIRDIESVESLSHLPHHWKLEKLTKDEHGTQVNYSVRINHGYRVIFYLGQAHTVQIAAISKTLSHGGH